MIKVLQVFGEPLSNGGQEAFYLNLYRNIDRKKVQFDFYTPFFCDNENFKNQIQKLGGKIYSSNGSFFREWNKKDFVKGLDSFLKEHKYEVIHINSGSIFSLAFGAKIAKKNGAKKIIVHSHATGIANIKYRVIKLISRNIFLKNATDYLACSKEAAIWKFPQKITNTNNYKIINNGIELDKFIYNERTRERYRKDFNIKKDEFVIGCVGRLELHKNHQYLIEVFEELLKKCINAKLVLVGDGSLKEELIRTINEKNIKDKVILLEKRNDVNNILQLMDVFVFPSIFEGLGIVAIEAQAAGMHTICSEHIPEEANVTNLFHKIELKLGKEKWVDEILKYKEYTRKNTIEEIKDKGYDAKDSAKELTDIYLK